MNYSRIRRWTATKRLALGMVLIVGLLGGPLAAADTPGVRLQQTIENPAELSPAEQQAQLELAPIQEHSALLQFGDRVEPTAAKEILANSDILQLFRIYDARTELAGDVDDDGYFYRLRVTFDADVDSGEAAVYAMLFLSYEGGPWNHYFTTDVFYLYEDASFDDYEVVTQLLEGYPTGYYDLLIELYEADWDVHVASYGPYEDAALRAIPLEDQTRDYPHDDGGGGGLGWLSLMLLGAWGWRRAEISHPTG